MLIVGIIPARIYCNLHTVAHVTSDILLRSSLISVEIVSDVSRYRLVGNSLPIQVGITTHWGDARGGGRIAVEARLRSNSGSATPDKRKETFSAVIPLFNEDENLEPLYYELSEALGSLGGDYEILFTNDGSTDNSSEALARIWALHNEVPAAAGDCTAAAGTKLS